MLLNITHPFVVLTLYAKIIWTDAVYSNTKYGPTSVHACLLADALSKQKKRTTRART